MTVSRIAMRRLQLRLDCDSIRLPFNSHSTPRNCACYDHSTTYVTTAWPTCCGCCT